MIPLISNAGTANNQGSASVPYPTSRIPFFVHTIRCVSKCHRERKRKMASSPGPVSLPTGASSLVRRKRAGWLAAALGRRPLDLGFRRVGSCPQNLEVGLICYADRLAPKPVRGLQGPRDPLDGRRQFVFCSFRRLSNSELLLLKSGSIRLS